jgi:hypothetical protein
MIVAVSAMKATAILAIAESAAMIVVVVAIMIVVDRMKSRVGRVNRASQIVDHNVNHVQQVNEARMIVLAVNIREMNNLVVNNLVVNNRAVSGHTRSALNDRIRIVRNANNHRAISLVPKELAALNATAFTASVHKAKALVLRDQLVSVTNAIAMIVL